MIREGCPPDLPEMFRKDENTQCNRGSSCREKDPPGGQVLNHLGFCQVKTRSPPRSAKAQPLCTEPWIDYSEPSTRATASGRGPSLGMGSRGKGSLRGVALSGAQRSRRETKWVPPFRLSAKLGAHPLAFTAAIPAGNAFVHRNPPALNMLCQVCP
jgi:hypothetical protein